MFMGVVGRPREDKGFNGKIYLKRVSEEVSLQKRATNQNFSPDRNINSDLKNGVWRMLFPGGNGVICAEMRELQS